MGENMLDFLRAEMLQARLRQDTAWVKVVSTAIGDLERKYNKDFVSRDQMVAWAKSQLKAIDESRSKAEKFGQTFVADELYVKLLNSMLPVQMTEDDLYNFFTKECSGVENLGEMMKELKTRRAGMYDGKLASAVARSVLPNITK